MNTIDSRLSMRIIKLALFLFSSSFATISAQSTYVYPQWNPDANYSGFIEASDLIQLLTVFNGPFGLDSGLFCEYDGTQFETFVGSVLAGDIIIDSLSVQFILSDITDEYYEPGCPDPLTDSVETFFSAMLYEYPATPPLLLWKGEVSPGYGNSPNFWMRLSFKPETGTYFCYIKVEDALVPFWNEGLYGSSGAEVSWPFGGYSDFELPWPESAFFDSSGIWFEPLGSQDWSFNNLGLYVGDNAADDVWADYITYWSMIPFWHYAWEVD